VFIINSPLTKGDKGGYKRTKRNDFRTSGDRKIGGKQKINKALKLKGF
jgi:hypothetical protein